MEMRGMLGERLGVIGQREESTPELPAWKRDFLSLPSISVRKGIAWSYDPPYEDTDTLVLTAPSGKFVDVRYPKDLASSDQVQGHSSFWAFSGKSETTFYDSVGGRKDSLSLPYMAHCKFIHDIDSRGPGIEDEGDMFLLPNGDVSEMGMMMNPSSGTNELYKEYWTTPTSSMAATASDVSSELKKSPCLVAEVVGIPSVKGIAIRIGDHLQGIVDNSNEVLSERRILAVQDTDARTSSMNWMQDSRSSSIMPTTWLCEATRKGGDCIDHKGVIWEITECHL